MIIKEDGPCWRETVVVVKCTRHLRQHVHRFYIEKCSISVSTNIYIGSYANTGIEQLFKHLNSISIITDRYHNQWKFNISCKSIWNIICIYLSFDRRKYIGGNGNRTWTNR